MILQATLTVSEAKRVIAKGVAQLAAVRTALKNGKIFLKGGTTVSAVCEELSGRNLRISGRISPDGTKTADNPQSGSHCGLIDKGHFIGLDSDLKEVVSQLGANDVAIIGANAIDIHGAAALMYGVSLGGPPGEIISGLMAEIKNLIIAVGWEKLVPLPVGDIVARTGRKNVDLAMGAAVGLTPLFGGMTMTETTALSALAAVDCTVIGMGGVFGAEGATTMIIEGEKEEVEKAFEIISSVKGQGISGTPESFEACHFPSEMCKMHRACVYKKTKNKAP